MCRLCFRLIYFELKCFNWLLSFSPFVQSCIYWRSCLMKQKRRINSLLKGFVFDCNSYWFCFDFLNFLQLFCRTQNELKNASKQMDVQSLDDRKEKLAESAKNKLKHGLLKKLQMFANEKQYIVLAEKYFGKKILFVFLLFITECL